MALLRSVARKLLSRIALDQGGQPWVRPLPLPQRQLAFMHIPKCAGTALASQLGRKLFPCRVINNLQLIKYCAPQYLQSVDFIHGHFDFRQVAKFRPDCFLFTVMRHPVDRLMSFYYNVRSNETGFEAQFPVLVDTCRSGSLTDFARSKDPQVTQWAQNAMCRQIAGVDPNHRYIDTELAKIAIDCLSKFNFVGLQERMDQTMAMLDFLLNLPVSEFIPRENVTPQREALHTITEAERQALSEITGADILLYDHAQEEFADKWNRLAPLVGFDRGRVAG